MAKPISGNIRWLHGQAITRVRVTTDRREDFALPTCATESEARERSLVVARAAKMLRTSQLSAERVREALTLLASTPLNMLEQARVAVDNLARGTTSELGSIASSYEDNRLRLFGLQVTELDAAELREFLLPESERNTDRWRSQVQCSTCSSKVNSLASRKRAAREHADIVAAVSKRLRIARLEECVRANVIEAIASAASVSFGSEDELIGFLLEADAQQFVGIVEHKLARLLQAFFDAQQFDKINVVAAMLVAANESIDRLTNGQVAAE